MFGTVANGINDRGDIVGNYVKIINGQNIRLGFLWRQGAYTTLRVSDANFTVASGTNNSGTVVGTYGDQPPPAPTHGFVWKNGVYTTVDYPKAKTTSISSINAQGEIAGTYDDAEGVTHGFVAR